MNQTFAASRDVYKHSTASSPWKRYVVRQRGWKFCLFSLIAGISFGAVAFVYARVDNAPGFPQLAILMSSFLCAFCGILASISFFSNLGIDSIGHSGFGDDLRGFEKHLERVTRALHLCIPCREIHLMTRKEVEEQAEKVLVHIASTVLKSERDQGRGSEPVEEARAWLGREFDLFAEYGLVNRKNGYRPFYDLAEKHLASVSTPVAEAQLVSASAPEPT